MKQKKVLVIGYKGKMGQISIDAIKKSTYLKFAGGCGSRDNLEQTIKNTSPDIIIDLSNCHSVYKNAICVINKSINLVIGASGLKKNEIKNLEDLCANKKLGAIIVPNFSIGAVLMMQLSANIAKFFPNVVISETHHPNKKDAPSATAINTAELIHNNRSLEEIKHKSTELHKGCLGSNVSNIPIHSYRIPGKLAHQTVLFSNYGESLSITHDTLSRDAFLKGICLSLEKVCQLNKMYIGLDNILDI